MIRVSFKDSSVKAHRLHPQLLWALSVAAPIWEMFGANELVVTSLNDGNHRVGSFHFRGEAADLRTKNIPTSHDKRNARDLLSGHLGRDWDVILEDLGGVNEHVHLEYDPKP